MHHIGLDYHLRTSSIHIVNGDGARVKSDKLVGDWQIVVRYIEHFAKQINDSITVCYEASCGYGHLYDHLRKIVKHVVVAHPGHLRLIFKSRKKNDRVDARKLATLSLLDQVPRVHVPREDGRAWRRFIEYRDRLVADRTRVKNKLRAVLRTHGIKGPAGKKLWNAKGMAWLEAQTFARNTDTVMRDMALDDVRSCDAKIKRVEKELWKIAQQHPGVALLRTIPGVGLRTAEAMIAYIDDPWRFARHKCIGSYFGLIPCEDSSAATHRLGHITKEGPATARKLLVEASWQAIRRSPTVRAQFERIAGGKKNRRKIALVATAHYLSRVMLSMLKSGETWRETVEQEAAQGVDG